jgi:hypothetical protein
LKVDQPPPLVRQKGYYKEEEKPAVVEKKKAVRKPRVKKAAIEAKPVEVKQEAPVAANNADDDIPDDILNYSKKGNNVQDAKARFKEEAGKTNALLTINPNISVEKLDKQGRIDIYRALRSASESLKDEIIKGTVLKPKGLPSATFVPPPLTKYEFRTEVGEKTSYIHIHAIAQFDGTTHFDLPQLRNHYFKYLNRWREKPDEIYINVRTYLDSAKLVEAYINKMEKNVAFDKVAKVE